MRLSESCYSTRMTDLHDFITTRPEELIDSLADGPRAGTLNLNPEEVQDLLAQIHAEVGDRDFAGSSDAERADEAALSRHLDGDGIPM